MLPDPGRRDQGTQVLAHLSRTSALADAKDLFRAGIDGFVHTDRDRDVDQEYLELVKAHPNVWTGPNIPNPDATESDISSLAEALPADHIARMRQEIAPGKTSGNSAPGELFQLDCRNLRKIHDAGMTIGLGTDGTDNGFGAHEQLTSYARCGMTAHEAIVAATGTNARILGLEKLGTITAASEQTSSCWTPTLQAIERRHQGVVRNTARSWGARNPGGVRGFARQILVERSSCRFDTAVIRTRQMSPSCSSSPSLSPSFSARTPMRSSNVSHRFVCGVSGYTM